MCHIQSDNFPIPTIYHTSDKIGIFDMKEKNQKNAHILKFCENLYFVEIEIFCMNFHIATDNLWQITGVNIPLNTTIHYDALLTPKIFCIIGFACYSRIHSQILNSLIAKKCINTKKGQIFTSASLTYFSFVFLFVIFVGHIYYS